MLRLYEKNSSTTFCTAFDLRVESALLIPGSIAEAPASQHSPPDLRIDLGPASLPLPAKTLRSYATDGSRLLYEKPDCARYLCGLRNNHASRITVEPAPGGDPDEIATMLIATALPAALWLRGEIMLHAAAALLPGSDRAIAFAGTSGSGKSTLLQALLSAGSRIVAEDSLCLQTSPEGRHSVSGLPALLYLRPPGAGLHTPRAIHPVPAPQQVRSAELAAIVLMPEPAGPTEPPSPAPLLRLDTTNALQALLRHRHRPAVPQLLGQQAQTFTRLAAVAGSVPVHFWNTLDLASFPPERILEALRALL